MANPTASEITEKTDLTTLVGDDAEYRDLVWAKFHTDVGNVTWGEAKLTTKDKFLTEYGSNNPGIRSKLRKWLQHYGLEGGFKPKQDAPDQQQKALGQQPIEHNDPFKTPKPPSRHQENDPYKTTRTKSQPENNKLSPTLMRALQKLKNKQIDLNDLPMDNEHKGWSDIETRAEFSALELSAVQNYRKRLAQEQHNEIGIPEDIDRVIREYDSRKRQPFSSTRLNSDISTLYQYKDRPDFLTFRLGEQNYSDQVTRATIEKAMEKAPVCVAGVSGAGKTRTVLELLSTHWGIYFSAGMYLTWASQPDKPCSTDLAWIAENSAADPQKDTYTRTVQRLECAIVARFLILEEKIKTVEGFNFLDWTLMQLYPPIVSGQGRECDVFEALTIELYSNSYNTKQIAKVLRKLPTLFKYIVVDEAQVAMAQNPERYDNLDKSAQHPFLFAVIRCLWNIGKTCGMSPILCGTGISIMKMSSIAISAVGEVETRHARDPGEKCKLQVPITTVLEPKAILCLVRGFLQSGVCGQRQLGHWSRLLVGRPRILWGFLSLLLTNSDAVDVVFQEYCTNMTSGTGNRNATTTLYSCVQKALERKATGETSFSSSIGFAVTKLVVNWLTGMNPAELGDEDMVDVMVDCGVCILERKGSKLVAKLREPLVAQAYLKYVQNTSPDLILESIMEMLAAATEPSSQGFLFEILFYFAFQKWLNGKSLKAAGFAPDAKSCGESDGFLDEECDIPLESMGNSLLRLPEAPRGRGVQLQSEFLNCHCEYFESGTSGTKRPRPRAAATPAKKDLDDLVVVAPTNKHVLIFLIQCKLEKKSDYLKAAQTTFPELLLHQTHTEKRKKEEEKKHGRENYWTYDVPSANSTEQKALQDVLKSKRWGNRDVRVVQLVVAYPAKVENLRATRWIPVPGTTLGTSDDLADLLKTAPKPSEEKRLLVVLKASQLKKLLGDKLFGKLEAVKETEQQQADVQNADVPMNLYDLLPYD